MKAKFLSFLAILTLFGVQIQAQQEIIIPTKGKEFWLGYMDNAVTNNDNSYELFIASETNTTGFVTIPNIGYTQAFTVNADQTTSLQLPITPADIEGNQQIGDYGVYVETEDSVSVFALNFLQFSADASRILPVQSLGTSYRITSFPGVADYGSEFLIVATEDDTEIEITPSEALPDGEPAGVPFTINLNQGETYLVRSYNNFSDFTGTLIEGTEESGPCRPFVVISGTVCVNVPVGCTYCDHIMDQHLPLNTWGNEYHVIPFSFTDSYSIRILAHEDNTVVNTTIGNVTLDAGEFAEYNSIEDPLCITSSVGISVTQFMEGESCAGDGDPAMCTLNSAGQKIDNITFATVESTILNQHAINVIMATDAVGSLTLDGTLVDPNEFSPITDCPEMSYAQISIAEGVHTLDSPDGFTGYVYGVGSAESYFYSVGSFSSDEIEIQNVTCSNDTIVLSTQNSWTDIQWYAQSDPEVILGTGPSLTLVPPIVSDIYVANGNQFQSGCSQEEFFSVEVPDPPGLTLSQSASQVCQFQPVQLGVEVSPASGAYNFLWSPAEGLDDPTSPNPIATPLQTTTYSVYVYTNSECGTNTDSLTIEVIDGDVSYFEIVSEDPQLCSGEELALSLNFETPIFFDSFDPVNSANWSNVNLGIESENCGSESGNALWFNGTGSREATTVPLDLSQGGSISFSLKIGAESFPCDNADLGEDVILEYGIGGTWNPIQTFSQASYPSFTAINVEIPIAAQSPATSIRWRQLSNSGDGQDNWAIDNIFISATNPSVDFTWYPDYNLSSTNQLEVIATPAVDTTYYVTYTDPITGCSYTDSTEVEVDQSFTMEVSNDTTICGSESIQLFASPNEPGDYSWLWSGEGLSSFSAENPIADLSETQTFHVSVTTSNGCSLQDSVTISVLSIADISITASSPSLCEGESTLLVTNVTGSVDGSIIQWSPSTGLTDPTVLTTLATPTETTVYTISIQSQNGLCTTSESVEIEVIPAFSVNAGPDLILCTTSGTQLNASSDHPNPGELNWSWNNPFLLNNSSIPNPLITADGSYTFTVTASTEDGCSAQDEVNVTLLYEDFDLGGPFTICDEDTISIGIENTDELNATWSTGESSSTIQVSQAGEYTLTLVSGEGCEYTDSAILNVNPLPVIDFGTIPVLCDGDVYSLNAGNPGSSYSWSTGSNNQSISVSNDGIYEVNVTNTFQCSSSGEVELDFQPVPVLVMDPFYRICQGEFVFLSPGSSIHSYEWSTGSTSSSISVGSSGNYSVVATSNVGCTSQISTTIAVEPLPLFDLGPDQFLCVGDRAEFDAGSDEYSYLWSDGDTVRTNHMISTGTLSLTAATEYCTYTDSVFVSFDTPPFNRLPNEIVFCFEDCPYDLLVDAGNEGATFLWNTDSTRQFLTIDRPGIYNVEITSPLGCKRAFSTDVIEICKGGNVFIPNAFTPNGDGLNDIFNVVAPEGIEDFELRIFNRIGEMVFSTTDPLEGWNGNSGSGGDYYGQAEVYVYTIKYRYYTDCEGVDFEMFDSNGHITLIR